MIFYRYESMGYWVNDWHTEERIYEEEYHLVKETPCGWWIHPDEFYKEKKDDPNHLFWTHDEKPRWVSKTSRKKFAYPTKEEALNGFVRRKQRQICILRHKLLRAENALAIAKGGDLTLGLQNSIELRLDGSFFGEKHEDRPGFIHDASASG